MTTSSVSMPPSAGMRTFYTLAVTQTISILGSRMSGFAIALYISAQTQQVTPLAMVSLFGLIPMLLMSNVAGMLADRWDRRYVMALADFGQALGTLLLFFLFTSGYFELWHLYAVTFVQSLFGIFQQPASEAAISMLVPPEHRDRANAIRQVSGPASGIIAPVLTGALYGLIGVGGIIVIDLLTFLLAVTVVLLVHIPRPPVSKESVTLGGSAMKEMFAGAAFLRKRPQLVTMLLLASFVNVVFSAVLTGSIPYLIGRTGSAATAGAITSIEGIAGLLGGVVIGIWGGTRPRIHTIMIGLVVMSVGLIGLGLSQNALALSAMLFILVFPNPMVNAMFMSLMQNKTPPDMQGRVFAVMGQLAMLLTPIGLLTIPALTDRVIEPAVKTASWQQFAPLVGNGPGAGIGLTMVIAGVVIGISVLLVYAQPSIRTAERDLPDYMPQTEDAPDASALVSYQPEAELKPQHAESVG